MYLMGAKEGVWTEEPIIPGCVPRSCHGWPPFCSLLHFPREAFKWLHVALV